jgi:hypothetical protein
MTINFDFLIDLSTKIVGVLGFLLSLYVFYVNRTDKKPQLKLEIFHEVIDNDDNNEYGFSSPPDDSVVITIYNPALIRARLVSLEIESGSKKDRKSKSIFLENSPFSKPPSWVEPHDKISLWSDMESFLMWLGTDLQDENIQAVAKISSGKNYRSNKMKRNLYSFYYSVKNGKAG